MQYQTGNGRAHLEGVLRKPRSVAVLGHSNVECSVLIRRTFSEGTGKARAGRDDFHVVPLFRRELKVGRDGTRPYRRLGLPKQALNCVLIG